jgi:O-antigen/teichoic acid export membrane protein
LFNIGIETAFMIMMTVALIITALLIKYNYQPIDSVDLKKFYQIGISAFIINGAAVIAFNADKFLINNFFSIDTANAYTFAWTLIAPSFYIGTLIEKGIYSEKAETNLIRKTKRYSILLLAALVLYFGALTFAVKLFPNLIPNSLQQSVLIDLLYIMIPGFLLFTLIHTPVNAVLFKLYKDKIRSKIALLFAPVIALFLITMFILTQIELNNNVLLILSITWLYLFILQGIKIYLMYSNHKLNFID